MDKILFIGAGHMNTALIKGLLASGYPKESVFLANRGVEKGQRISKSLGIQWVESPQLLINQVRFCVLGVKPHDVRDALSQWDFSQTTQPITFVSLAAGVPIRLLCQQLPHNVHVMRCMPNLATSVQQGISVLFSSERTHPSCQLVEALFHRLGLVVWAKAEDELAFMTALVGSGPAFLLRFLEGFQVQAVAAGMSEERAAQICTQLFLGTASLASSDAPLESLRGQVTSSGGTTAAGLSVMESLQTDRQVAEILQAAIDRAHTIESDSCT